jgi:hypothetical protein
MTDEMHNDHPVQWVELSYREIVINLVVPYSYPTVSQRKNIRAREKRGDCGARQIDIAG